MPLREYRNTILTERLKEMHCTEITAKAYLLLKKKTLCEQQTKYFHNSTFAFYIFYMYSAVFFSIIFHCTFVFYKGSFKCILYICVLQLFYWFIFYIFSCLYCALFCIAHLYFARFFLHLYFAIYIFILQGFFLCIFYICILHCTLFIFAFLKHFTFAFG